MSDVTIISDSDENKQSYYKTEATSVTRTNTPLFETSQSVQIVTDDVLDDMSMVSLDDTLDYVSGISRQKNFGGVWDNFAIRGFAGHENTGISMLKNGFADNRGYNAPRDAANIESIEVLKGPSGSLYGNTDPSGVYSIAAGEVRSQGIEFDVSGKLNSHIKINANYTYTDTEVTKDAGGAVDWATGEVVNLVGKALSNIPKHSGSLLLMWEDSLSNKSSYGVGSNVIYVGEREGNYINTFKLPDYTTVGVLSYWQVNKNLKMKLNVNNIFDEEYIASSYGRSWVVPGSQRSFTLSMNYKF